MLKQKGGINYRIRILPKPGINKELLVPIPVIVDKNAAFEIRDTGFVADGKLYKRELLRGVMIQVEFTDDRETINVQNSSGPAKA